MKQVTVTNEVKVRVVSDGHPTTAVVCGAGPMTMKLLKLLVCNGKKFAEEYAKQHGMSVFSYANKRLHVSPQLDEFLVGVAGNNHHEKLASLPEALDYNYYRRYHEFPRR